MAFIKAQKIVRDENGVITSGSAAIVDTVYISTGSKNHSKHNVREKLGKVLYLSEDRKSGIFMSPTRGLVEYNALTDSFESVERDDSRICRQEIFPDTEIHTVFGDAFLSNSALEKDLIARFPITRAVLVPDLLGNQQILLQDVCGALAEDLPRYIKNDSVVGIAWGHTLAVLAKQLKKIKRTGVSVIQFSGGFSRAIYESSALDIIKNFVECVGGTGYQIPAPAMVDQAFIADALKQDSQIRHVLELAEICQTAVFSVGSLERPSVLYEMGVISDTEYLDFRRRGAVGDCCSHFLNKNGGLFDVDLDKRVVV